MSISTSAAGRPTGRPRSGAPTHVQRPGSGSGYLLATEALANPPPEVTPTDPPEARGGGGTRNAVPLYDVPAHRILHHLVRAPARPHLGAARPGRAAQRLCHRDR